MARFEKKPKRLWQVTLLSLCLLAATPIGVAYSWVSPRSHKGPVYAVPFTPQWVSRVKKGKWFKYKRHEFSSPVASADRIFVGSDSGYLYAMTLKKGKKRWRFKTEGAVNATPAASAGKVFFGDDNGVLYALDMATGEAIWTRRYRSPVMSQPLVVSSRLFGVTLQGMVFALDAETGSPLWTYVTDLPRQEMTLYGQSAPAYDRGGRQERLYVGLADGRLLALEAGKGQLVWSRQLAEGVPRLADVDMQPLLDGDRLYAASFSGGLFCLNKKTGATIWQAAIGSGVGFALSGETLYLSDADGVLYALDKMTGSERWKLDLAPGALSRPLVYGDLLAVASTEQSVIFVDTRNGQRVMQRFARKNVASDPILAGEGGNLLVYLSNGGRLYALTLKDQFRIK